MELKPPTEHPVLFGPAISDAPALAQWLGAQRADDGELATVRLPVTLEATGPVGSVTQRLERSR